MIYVFKVCIFWIEIIRLKSLVQLMSVTFSSSLNFLESTCSNSTCLYSMTHSFVPFEISVNLKEYSSVVHPYLQSSRPCPIDLYEETAILMLLHIFVVFAAMFIVFVDVSLFCVAMLMVFLSVAPQLNPPSYPKNLSPQPVSYTHLPTPQTP